VDGIIVGLLPLPLLVLWAWMFSDMAKNQDLPGCFITVSGGRDPRLDWNVAFVLLNIIAAGFYYSNVYRQNH
jgi:hypothetical protein